jgi:hypothetical protein
VAYLQSGRNNGTGRIRGGETVYTQWDDPSPSGKWMTEASVGFGADRTYYAPVQKRMFTTHFFLGAGHSGEVGKRNFRLNHAALNQYDVLTNGTQIGHVARDLLTQGSEQIDALAGKLNTDGLTPLTIYDGPPIGPPAVARRGMSVAISPPRTNEKSYGVVVGMKHHRFPDLPGKDLWLVVITGFKTCTGDSGAPVWSTRTHQAIGMLSGGHCAEGLRYVQPLLNTPTGRNGRHLPGALNASLMNDLRLATGG